MIPYNPNKFECQEKKVFDIGNLRYSAVGFNYNSPDMYGEVYGHVCGSVWEKIGENDTQKLFESIKLELEQ